MLDELFRTTHREWFAIFGEQLETMETLYDNIEQLRKVLDKDQAKNRKAISWVNEMEKNVTELLQGLRIIRKRVLRLQSTLDARPQRHESESDTDED